MTDLKSQVPDWVRYCNELENAIFITEGKRDRETLRSLGIKGKILEKGGLSLDELVDIAIRYSVVIILTDFDREGKYLRRSIVKEIQRRKRRIQIDTYARQFLYRLCRAHGITEIEDLDRFVPFTQKLFEKEN
ncbi:MAG: hypothetical protein JSV04_08540 [Candidatus Heimdallarchaeota archaeon]|nr:MAG: hypothetical protein JSV04_08540 [Candidatus Heimdallarchaeota archaeon]